jgi:DNA repair exonuclease SbcCD ATPase subunit
MDSKKPEQLSEQELEKKAEVEKLRKKLADQKKELEEAQSNCNHPKEKVDFISVDGDQKSLRVICAICKKPLRYPSDNDLEENGFK